MDVNSTDLLELALSAPKAQIDKMAHALGWPSVATMRGHGGRIGRVKWGNPYRNAFCGDRTDADWTAAEAAGLAENSTPRFETVCDTYWRVTRLGQLVVRLRLQAAKFAEMETKAVKRSKRTAAQPPEVT